MNKEMIISDEELKNIAKYLEIKNKYSRFYFKVEGDTEKYLYGHHCRGIGDEEIMEFLEHVAEKALNKDWHNFPYSNPQVIKNIKFFDVYDNCIENPIEYLENLKKESFDTISMLSQNQSIKERHQNLVGIYLYNIAYKALQK